MYYLVGAYASNICLATTQAAAKHGIPHAVDVGVSDKIVSRGLTNTFRCGPGFGAITKADTGTFQITVPNSTDMGRYGAYDTRTIDKDITAVMGVTFRVQ